MSLILFVAVALALAVGEWIEGGIIGFIIVINTVVGFMQVGGQGGREGGRMGREEGKDERREEAKVLHLHNTTTLSLTHTPLPSHPPSFHPFFSFQEYSSEQTMQALRRLSSPLARVRREGQVVEVGREGGRKYGKGGGEGGRLGRVKSNR